MRMNPLGPGVRAGLGGVGMTDSETGWLASDNVEGRGKGRLSRPMALLLIVGASLSLWALIAVGLGGF